MAPRPAATLTDAQRRDWLRLLRTDNVGPATFRQLLNRFGSADAALEALPGLLRRTGKPLRIPTQSEAEDEIAGLARYGARLVASGEPDYPPLLAYIPAAPPLITMAGGQNRANSEPILTASPLPPLKLSQAGKQWPRKAPIAASMAASSPQ